MPQYKAGLGDWISQELSFSRLANCKRTTNSFSGENLGPFYKAQRFLARFGDKTRVAKSIWGPSMTRYLLNLQIVPRRGLRCTLWFQVRRKNGDIVGSWPSEVLQA